MQRHRLAILTALLAAGPALAESSPLAAAPAVPAGVADVPVALLVDSGSGRWLYAAQADLRFVPASMTKVMTAYVAFDQMARGKLAPTTQFTVSDAVAREWNGKGTSLYLRGGERVSVDTLLHGITTVSANDAALTLALGHAGSVPAWAALMNAEAGKLGMTGSHFATPNGWPDNSATYVTARDLVTLGGALITRFPAQYRTYFGQKALTWNGVTQQNRDPTLGVVAGADGIKTGHTREAGFNFLGSARRDERRLIMVVAGAKSMAQRAAVSRALLEWGFAAWTTRPLFPAGRPIAEARVQGGDARRVALTSPVPVYATLAPGEGQALSLQVTYKGPLVAPIAKGAWVGELVIRSGPARIGTVPLYAARNVGVADPFDRLVNGFMGLFS